MTSTAQARCVCMPVVSHLPFDARVWKQAKTLRDAGYRVSLIGMRYELDRVHVYEEDGIEVTEIPFGTRARAGRLRHLVVRARALARLWLRTLITRADVYHCHNIHPAPAVLLGARLRGGVVVYDAHELYGEVPAGARLGARIAAAVSRLVERAIAGRAELVITTNDFRADVIRRRHALEAVLVIRNVPLLADPRPRDLGVPDGRHTLLYQGGVYADARAFEATIAALANLEDFEFVIIGFGRQSDLEQIRSWAREHGVEDRVHLRDPLPFEELVGTAAAATVGIVPLRAISTNSILGDTNKLFEYLMGGLPVVGSDFPEVRRVLSDGAVPVGEVFDPEDPLSIATAVRKVATVDHASRRAEARRLAVERHNWSLEDQRLRAAYADLMPSASA